MTECGRKLNRDVLEFIIDHIILPCPNMVLILKKFTAVYIFTNFTVGSTQIYLLIVIIDDC